MRQAFVEIHPFHEITLFYYHAHLSDTRSDVVFAHQSLFGRALFDSIPANRLLLRVPRFVRFLWRHRGGTCHFNTVNATLAPLTVENVTLILRTLALPTIARALGWRTTAIIHEADQFFDTGRDSCRRHTWYRRAIGWWFIRLFDTRYVLSQEVASFLRLKGITVEFLDPEPLSRFSAATSEHEATTRSIVWVGPVVSYRRAWRPLLELDHRRLANLNVTIQMLCDSRLDEGPEMRARLEENGLSRHFVFLDYRPDDVELFAAARRSLGVLCLYAGEEYGTTKTSGARIIAGAMSKAFIATNPSLGVYLPDGTRCAATQSLTDAIEELCQVTEADGLRRTEPVQAPLVPPDGR